MSGGTVTSTEVVASNHAEGYTLLTETVREHLEDFDRPLRVIEAGCGRAWTLGEIGERHITGIDLDAEAMRLRIEVAQDLDQAVLGDLMTVELERGAYDLVFSSYVLEHLEHPDVALDRYFSWLRPGGLVAIIIPDRDTAKGFTTRISPFFLHVWYYRWIKGRKTAGKPGYEPYHTHYGKVVGVKGIEEYCRSRNRRVVRKILIATNSSDDGRITSWASRAIQLLSFGRLNGEYCNVAIVLEA